MSNQRTVIKRFTNLFMFLSLVKSRVMEPFFLSLKYKSAETFVWKRVREWEKKVILHQTIFEFTLIVSSTKNIFFQLKRLVGTLNVEYTLKLVFVFAVLMHSALTRIAEKAKKKKSPLLCFNCCSISNVNIFCFDLIFSLCISSSSSLSTLNFVQNNTWKVDAFFFFSFSIFLFGLHRHNVGSSWSVMTTTETIYNFFLLGFCGSHFPFFVWKFHRHALTFLCINVEQ